MKYYLNEGFFLEEHKKYILLEEDEQPISAQIKSLTKKILDKITAANVADNDKDIKEFNQFKDDFYSKLKNNKPINGNWSSLTSEVKQYLTKFNKIFPEDKWNQFPNIVTAIKDLKDAAGYTSDDGYEILGDYKKLIPAFNSFTSAVETLFANALPNGNVIKEIENSLAELNKVDKEGRADSILQQLTKISDEIAEQDNDNLKSTEALNKILESIKNILNTKATKTTDTTDTTNEKDTTTINGTEWAELYRNIGKKNSPYGDAASFWDDYFKKAWGDNSENIKNTSEAFRQECVSLGFTKELNPFIDFLSQDDEKFANKNTVKWDANNYGALHNAFVDTLINKKDLRGNGDLRKNNIIFNEDLYTKSNYDIIEYLTLQKNIINKNKNKIALQTELPEGYNDYKTNWDNDEISEFINKLFMKDKKLKPISQIKQDIAVLFGDEDTVKKSANTKEAFETVANGFNLENLGNDGKKLLITWLLLTYADEKAFRNYVNTNSLDTINVPTQKIIDFKRQANNLPYLIDNKNVTNITKVIENSINKK